MNNGCKNEATLHKRLFNNVRAENIRAALMAADILKTSFGPFGMDKLILKKDNNVLVTNDGATILNEIKAVHPAAKILSELSRSQDLEIGDGTTSVVLFASLLVSEAQKLLDKNIPTQSIINGFLKANSISQDILTAMERSIDLNDHDCLIKVVSAGLATKVVSSFNYCLAKLAVDAALSCFKVGTNDIDLRKIRVVTQCMGTAEDSELVNGIVLPNNIISAVCGGPRCVENAKLAVIQFCLSNPKSYLDQEIQVSDYRCIDRLIKQEKIYINNIIRKIKNTGCNALIIQKSILKEAANSLALDLLAKAGILLIKDVEREDIDFICNSLNCEPISSLEYFTEEKLVTVKRIDEDRRGDLNMVKIVAVENCDAISVILRASNDLSLGELERSFRDAICLVRTLCKHPAILPCGGACEIELSSKINELVLNEEIVASFSLKAFATALEGLVYNLLNNSGINAIQCVSELKKLHYSGNKLAAVDVNLGEIINISYDNSQLIQPSLVIKSILNFATETAQLLLRIDDIVLCK